MKKKLLIIISLFLISVVCASDLVYKVNLDIYKNDTVVLNSVETDDGLISHFPTSETGYEIKIFSEKNELFSGNLPLSFDLMLDPPLSSFDVDKRNIELRLPYYSKADSIVLYHSGKEIFSINLEKDKVNLWILLIIPVLAILFFIIGKAVKMNKLKQQKQNILQ